MNTNSRFRPARRKLLKRAGLSALVLIDMMSRNARAAVAKPRGIDQPARGTPQDFTDRAFAMMQQAVNSGDQPYGAVVVKDGRIVGQSQSRVILDRDPTGHAEMAAIRDAAKRLATRELSGCVMYSSSKPCPMCEAAAYWAGLDRYFHGPNITDGGAPLLCG